MVTCPNCGKDLPNEARFCDACGSNLAGGPKQNQPSYPPQPPYYGNPYYISLPVKSDAVAIILAFLLPGLGHIYIGRVSEGILYMVLSFIITIAALIFFWLIIPLVIPFIFWIWQIIDVNNKTNQYNSILTQTGRAPW